MSKAEVWKISAAELRRIASRTREPEREGKMLALAEQLEAAERNERASEGRARKPSWPRTHHLQARNE